MATNEIRIEASSDAVYAALLDVTRYPDWLVGADHIRGVDAAWPQPGSSFHHAVGVGPLKIHDRTTVAEVEQPHHLVLEAFIGPFGSAKVRFEVTPEGSGAHLTMREVPARGFIRRLWSTAARPVVGAVIWGRNAASLEQLARQVEAGRGDLHDF